MIVTNSFKFGEISKKQAGRFNEEGYQQGSFQFKNARTLYDNGMARRFPLRTDVELYDVQATAQTKIYAIHGFSISDTESYLVAIGVLEESTPKNVVMLYRYESGTLTWKSTLSDSLFKEIDSSSSTSYGFIFASYDTATQSLKNVPLSEDICRSMRFAQYYNRLYIVSHKFRTVYIELTGGVFSAHIASFIFNQDSRKKIWFATYKDSSYEGVDTGKQKGLVLFKSSDGTFYTDMERTTPFVMNSSIYNNPVLATSSYVSGFNDYDDDTDLNTGVGTYPSVIAIIGDSLFLANTESKRSTVWKSRPIGNSQWISDYSADSMHDFTQFQVVSTIEEALKDSSEWPTKDSGYYETENGVETWYVPSKSTNGAYTYAERLVREYKDTVIYGKNLIFFTRDDSGNDSSRYTWTGVANTPKEDSNGYYYMNGSSKVYLNYYTAKDLAGANPFVNSRQNPKFYYGVNDFKWYKVDSNGNKTSEYYPNGFVNDGSDDSHFPIRKSVQEYDLSNENELYQMQTTIDFVATDSCGSRFELNTGLDDSVRFISSGCDKILIGTSTAEWKLPTNFNAVSNFSSESYSNYGAIDCEPMKMNRSFFLVQRNNIIREFFLYQLYINVADVTAYKHEMVYSPIVDTVCRSAPEPTMVICMENGNLIEIMYDRDAGLNSMAEWYSGDGSSSNTPFKFKSLATVIYGNSNRIMALVEDSSGHRFICHFDESTTDYCDIIGKTNGTDRRLEYETKIETVYAEVNNQNLVFGKSKKAKGMHIRPYECGHIYVGNDERQLVKTNYALGNEDYYSPIFGKSNKQFSMIMKSCGNEPMNILAMAWEIDNGS